ncbi:MAG: cytochrome P450 [Acidimicrobiia bacterium]|nr:cytochrome P450 [Acidimicrobiia bacterium]
MTDVQDQDLDPEYDPFAAFDESAGIGQVRDPHAVFHELRAECPVQTGPLSARFGLEQSMEEAMLGDSEAVPHTVLSFAAVQQVLKDGETFSSSGYAETIGLLMGHSILEMDEPEHHQYRSLVQQAFTRKAMERWEADIVGPTVAENIDKFVDRGTADLVRELFFPFPVQVIAAMLGLPVDDLPQFHAKAVELISIISDIDRGLIASQWLYDYFTSVITDRRANPQDDVISVLVDAELDGVRLTDEEIIAFLRLLLPAGAETTYRSSSNLMFGLLTNPEQLDALRANRDLMPQAIEEGLRWEPPLTSIGRTASRDMEVEGVTIPAGSPVQVCMASANRDPARWDRPDDFDMFRDQQQHMAFAFGPHMCLGLHLARMETTVVINALLDRLPNLRLDPDAEDVHISGLAFRAPNHLPVLFG